MRILPISAPLIQGKGINFVVVSANIGSNQSERPNWRFIDQTQIWGTAHEPVQIGQTLAAAQNQITLNTED